MASRERSLLDLESCGSVLSILSQDEAKDVVSMMAMANEIEEFNYYPGFYTSTQAGHLVPMRRPSSPLLSPLSLGPRHHADLDDNSLTWLNESTTTPKSTEDMNFVNSKVSTH